MKKEIGLWIDHREAVIVILADGVEKTRRISSGSGKHIRYSGSAHSNTPEGLKEVTSEDRRDRKFTKDLNSFYDEVISEIQDADTIQLFGPGEAKGELEKRIRNAGLKANILGAETMDKMTDRQIAAKVREHFLTQHAPGKQRKNNRDENDRKSMAKKEMRGYHEQ